MAQRAIARIASRRSFVGLLSRWPLRRVLTLRAHFYLFCDPETMFVAKPIAEASGFRFWKPLIWDKRKIGMGWLELPMMWKPAFRTPKGAASSDCSASKV